MQALIGLFAILTFFFQGLYYAGIIDFGFSLLGPVAVVCPFYICILIYDLFWSSHAK